ncbi:MAG: sulfotransferase [Nitrospira sp.]
MPGVGGIVLVGIFGAGRNGSTLLMRLLDGSPGLWIYPIELNYLRTFASGSMKNRLKQWMSAGAGLADSGRAKLEEHRLATFHAWASEQLVELKQTYLDKLAEPAAVNVNPSQFIKDHVRGTLTDNLESFMEATWSIYDDRMLPAKPQFMFKSIEVADLPRYQRLFPDMKFVHIVRHPYSNYTSLKRTDMVQKQKPFWYQGGDILRLQLEARWIPHVRFALEGMQQDPARHHLVRYEDLCESADKTVAGICDWLGAGPPKEPACQTVLGGKHLKSLPSNSSLKGVETPAHVVADMAKAYGYDDILTERERELILLRTYELGCRLGYFDAQGAACLPNRLRLFSRWMPPDEWEYRNAGSRVRLVRALIERRLYLCRTLLLSGS